jgi:hypothetical protein
MPQDDSDGHTISDIFSFSIEKRILVKAQSAKQTNKQRNKGIDRKKSGDRKKRGRKKAESERER